MEIKVTCNGKSTVIYKSELEDLLESSNLPWFKNQLEYYVIGEQKDLIIRGEIL